MQQEWSVTQSENEQLMNNIQVDICAWRMRFSEEPNPMNPTEIHNPDYSLFKEWWIVFCLWTEQRVKIIQLYYHVYLIASSALSNGIWEALILSTARAESLPVGIYKMLIYSGIWTLK